MAGAYYNELDPFAAAWLRNLIKAGHTADGEVDERSIKKVKADDLKGFTQCHFFAGIGGWSYALRLAGWPDDRPVWTGSCPCQPFSQAGKRQGFADDRHLWPVWFDLIRNARPGIVFGEQVASATEWLGLVRSDLGSVDYVVGARPFEAASAGADHLRNRIGLVAYDMGNAKGVRSRRWSNDQDEGRRKYAFADPSSGSDVEHTPSIGRREGRTEHEIRCRRVATPGTSGAINLADHAGAICERRAGGISAQETRERGADWPQHGDSSFRPEYAGESHEWVLGADGKARRVKPGIRLLVNGFPNRVGLLRGFGNAIDPRAFAQFIGAAVEAIQDT